MTDDAALPIRQNKRNGSSASPEKFKKKKKKDVVHPPEDKSLAGEENEMPIEDVTAPKKNLPSSKIAKKKVTGTKNVFGSKSWKELKQKKKDLRLTRRKSSKATTYNDMVKAKKMWERVRMADCPPKEREQLIVAIHKSLEPNLKKLVFTHDGARVIQWLLKMGSPALRIVICDQLESALPLMAQSKYASFCVRRIFKYGSNESHAKVIRSFAGHVVKFVCHAVAGPVLEFVYSQFATSAQKAALRQEFYGSLSKVATPGTIHCLADVCKDMPELKEATLAETHRNIEKVLNKKLVRSSLLHAVIMDYLKMCPEMQSEMLAQLRPFLLDLLISKEGSRIAMMCIWQGSVKDRKAAVKLLKGKVKDIAMSEHGHWLLLAVFDCVDDTVLLKKIVVPELLSDLIEIASNEYGRQVILYLVGHRDPLYFHPAVVKILQDGDTNEISKKDPAVRRAELLEAMCDSLLDAIAADPHVWLAGNSIIMVTLAALKYGVGNSLSLALEALANFVSDQSNMLSFSDKECHAIEHSGVHFLLKKLIESDKDKGSTECFTSIIVSVIEPSTIEWWINCNRGCFVLVMLFEKGSEETKQKIKEKFSDKLLKKLKSMESAGARILLQKLV